MEGLDYPRVLIVRFRLSVQLLAQVLSPPRQVVEIQRRAGVAHRACWIALFVTCDVLGFKQAIAVEAEDVLSAHPLVGW